MGLTLERVKKNLFRLLLVLVVIVFLVVGFVVISSLLNNRSPGYRPLPEKNLFSVNAKVVKVDEAAKKINAESAAPPGWNKEWVLVVDDKTRIGTYESWQKAVAARDEAAQQGLPPAEQESKFGQQFKSLALTDLKAGDTIYVTADYDFVQRIEIPKVTAIYLQSVKE